MKRLFSKGKEFIKDKRRVAIAGVVLIAILVAFILPSFAALTPIKSIEVESSKLSYTDNTPGSWKVTKSAKWIEKGKARITIDIDTKLKTNDKRNDIILVLDLSNSMYGDKLNRLKEDMIYLVNKLIPEGNRFAIITFASNSEIVTDFTDDIDLLMTKINNINIIDNTRQDGGTNYYRALISVDDILKEHSYMGDRGCVALFLTDGYPSEDTPNEISQYCYLKSQYPYLTINGIQYEMGNTVLEPFQKVSDYQYIASLETLNTFLLKATVNPIAYSKLEITDYIDTNYFMVEDINFVNLEAGKVKMEGNQVIWNLDTFLSGNKYILTIDIKLKDEFLGKGGVYPTNQKIEINSKIEEVVDNITSKDTPRLADNYKVIYEGNAPEGCTVMNMPSDQYLSVFDVFAISDEKPVCEGYNFKGWKVINDEIEKVNDDYYIMPEQNVIVRAVWGRSSIAKSMKGAVYIIPTLYSVLQIEANNGGLAKEYTGPHQDSLIGEENWKIYHYYAENETDAETVKNKNNVIFAGQCWQMIRTTDTGGVKMIYNGESVDGKCLDTRDDHVGYGLLVKVDLRNSLWGRQNSWYGTDYTYDSSTKEFHLSGELTQEGLSDRLIGKYTCNLTSSTGTCHELYYIENVADRGMFLKNSLAITLHPSAYYSALGVLQFNAALYINSFFSRLSLAHVGYMYNTLYSLLSRSLTYSETVVNSSSLNTTYWYANDVKWSESTADVWNLVSPYQISSPDEYPSLVGKFTFQNAAETYTDTVQYITAVDNSTYYYINLQSGNGLDYYNYTYGDSYIDNGDGTYTINSPTTIRKTDWSHNYSKIKNKYVCKNTTNNRCSDLWYITDTTSTDFSYQPLVKYANTYTYTDGKYILDNASSVKFWDINNSENQAKLNNAHYTCFNAAGECNSISYIYYLDSTRMLYITLSDGKSVEDALREMLSADNVNTTNSTVKTAIDKWYEKYLKEYTKYLEDTVFCNDRSISNLGGWNPNGGKVNDSLRFKASSIKDLSCSNETDRFSTLNDKAKLTYPVGLMTASESNLLGYAAKSAESYWTLSPLDLLYRDVYNAIVPSNDSPSSDPILDVSNGYSVRPVISLAPGTMYSEGDGSMEAPYVVEMER